MFDLAGTGKEASTHRREGDDRAIGVETTIEGAVLTRRMTTFREIGDGSYRRGAETHVQRLVDKPEVLDLLGAAGFDAHAEIGYAGEEFSPGHRAYFARRAS